MRTTRLAKDLKSTAGDVLAHLDYKITTLKCRREGELGELLAEMIEMWDFFDHCKKLSVMFEERPIADLAVPAPIFRSFALGKVTVVITENLRNFLSLPPLPNSVALLGSGDAAALLANAPWLANSRILYWGDMDARGFAILGRLRAQYNHVESVLMDSATLDAHRCWAVEVPQTSSKSGLLTSEESSVLAQICEQNLRLEQERIPFPAIVQALTNRVGSYDQLSVALKSTV